MTASDPAKRVAKISRSPLSFVMALRMAIATYGYADIIDAVVTTVGTILWPLLGIF